mgnify:CR=1 FL=1
MRNNKFMRGLVRVHWQLPLFIVITLYSGYKYGLLSWKTLAMVVVTIVFGIIFLMKKKRK